MRCRSASVLKAGEHFVATLMQYAKIAAAVYKDEKVMLEQLTAGGCGGWAVRFWQAGSASCGFQGVILENESEVICAFKGSKFGVTGYQDWVVNDGAIALGMMPKQAHSAAEMVEVAERYICGARGNRSKPLSIVGHSLGGGLAQLVGYIRGTPFVTFNAPGMKSQVSSLLPFTTKIESGGGKVNGFNMIIWTDPVGNAGRHLGKTERFINRGSGIAHKMGAVLGTLESNAGWSGKMLHQLL